MKAYNADRHMTHDPAIGIGWRGSVSNRMDVHLRLLPQPIVGELSEMLETHSLVDDPIGAGL
jgi:hypothetical protein